MNETHTFNLEFPAGHFTLAEFNAWVERELNAARAAWLSKGDVFKAEAVKQPTLVKRVAKAFVKKHDIYLTSTNVRSNNNSYYLTITGLNNLRYEGATELNITYETEHCTYNALIPMSAIDPNQNSITVTLRHPHNWEDYSYYSYCPNRYTKWGSYFLEVED